MKWTLYIFSCLIALTAGYFLGAQQTRLQHTNQTIVSQTSPLVNTPPKPKVAASSNQNNPRCCASEDNRKANSSTHKKPSLLVLFSQLLESSQYLSAMNIATDPWQSPEDNSSLFQQTFIQHIAELLTETPEEHERIQEAANQYLTNFYEDIDVLLLLAQSYMNQTLFNDSLSTLQLAKNYAYNEEQKQQVRNLYDHAVVLMESLFSEKKQRGELIDLYLFAEKKELLSNKDTLRLIALYLQTDDYDKAEYYTENLPASAEWQDKAAELFSAYQTRKDRDSQSAIKSSIPLKNVSNQYIATVNFSNVATNLLIDTGASMTTISQDYYDAIESSTSMTYQRQQNFLTANGQTTGDIYRLDTLAIGPYTLENIDIAVLDYPNPPQASGLLGMDILRHFKFEIDQKKNLLYLQKN